MRSLARGLLDLIHEPRPDDDDAAAGGSEADVWNELRPIDGEPPKDVRSACARRSWLMPVKSWITTTPGHGGGVVGTAQYAGMIPCPV